MILPCSRLQGITIFSDSKWVSNLNLSECDQKLNCCTIISYRLGKIFCLVNQFTISRLFIFLRRYWKTKIQKKSITTKISNIKKRRYNLFEKNRILNIYSICNYSPFIFSQLRLHIISFISDLIFLLIFLLVMMHL